MIGWSLVATLPREWGAVGDARRCFQFQLENVLAAGEFLIEKVSSGDYPVRFPEHLAAFSAGQRPAVPLREVRHADLPESGRQAGLVAVADVQGAVLGLVAEPSKPPERNAQENPLCAAKLTVAALLGLYALKGTSVAGSSRRMAFTPCDWRKRLPPPTRRLHTRPSCSPADSRIRPRSRCRPVPPSMIEPVNSASQLAGSGARARHVLSLRPECQQNDRGKIMQRTIGTTLLLLYCETVDSGRPAAGLRQRFALGAFFAFFCLSMYGLNSQRSFHAGR